MKNNLFLRGAHFAMAFLVLFTLSGCSTLESDYNTKEAEKANASLDRSRPENAFEKPDPDCEISDVRVTILDRDYYVPAYLDDFQNLSMMQIWYGYYSEGTWYDYPSENYDLVGILNNIDHDPDKAWKSAIKSHMVKIGPYLLINIAIQTNPTMEYQITDSLGSEIQEPFAQYNTYRYYKDENGDVHYYLDDHSHGYGSIAENPAEDRGPDTGMAIMSCEFFRRFYLILDYESIPEDYELSVLITGRNQMDKESYTLTGDMIQAMIG